MWLSHCWNQFSPQTDLTVSITLLVIQSLQNGLNKTSQKTKQKTEKHEINGLQENEVKAFMCLVHIQNKIKCTEGKRLFAKTKRQQANISYLDPAHVLQVKYQTKCKSCLKAKHQFNMVFFFPMWHISGKPQTSSLVGSGTTSLVPLVLGLEPLQYLSHLGNGEISSLQDLRGP